MEIATTWGGQTAPTSKSLNESKSGVTFEKLPPDEQDRIRRREIEKEALQLFIKQVKPTSKSLNESNTSITLKLKGGAYLCIQKDAGELYKLFYVAAGDSGRHELNQIGTVRLDDLESSLSLLSGCFGTATIKTKIGDLHVADYRHAGRLRKWLSSDK